MPDEIPGSSPDATDSLASLSTAQRADWRLTGNFPSESTEQAPDAPADSSPAEPVEQAVSTDTPIPPASKPGTPTTRKPNAESRKAELKAEIDTLLAERARVRAELDADRAARPPAAPQTPTPAASSPAKADAPFPTFDQWIAADQTRLNAADAYLDYIDARSEAKSLSVWEAKQRDAQSQAEQRTRQQTVETRRSALRDRLTAAITADPDWIAKLDPRWKDAVPVDVLPAGTQPNALNIVAQEVLLSEHAAALMAHLSANPSEFDRLLSYQTQDAIVRAMGRLEVTVSSVRPTPVVKTTTSAPRPGSSLGSRPTTGVSATQGAVADGNFRRYFAEKNREEVTS